MFFGIHFLFVCRRYKYNLCNNNLRTLESTVNSELAKVSEWLKANKLTLNIKNLTTLFFVLVKRLCLLFLKLKFQPYVEHSDKP